MAYQDPWEFSAPWEKKQIWEKRAPWDKLYFLDTPRSYTPRYDDYTFDSGEEEESTLERYLSGEEASPDFPMGEPKEERPWWDRVIDPLSVFNYTLAGGTKNLLDDNPNTGFWGGVWEGLKASNPFGDGNEAGEATWSDVLETAGWQPDSGIGKFTKGAIGFVGDVLLDPSTYLTLGAGAVVKGSGRVGAATIKSLDDIGAEASKIAKTSRYDDLIEKGVNPDLVERFMQKQADDGRFNFDASKGMTDEIASVFVNHQNKLKGLNRTPEEVADMSTKLADSYNKALGIYDARNAGRVSFGLGNVPFAPESWQRFNLDFGSAQGVRKFADTIGTARLYKGLRNSIYGSFVGKAFSNTSAIVKLANESPAKLWEHLEYVNMTQGHALDKLNAEKRVQDLGKHLAGLNPSENKEIIDLMENPYAFKPIREKLEFTENEKFKEVAAAFEKEQERLSGKIQSIKDKRDSIGVLEDTLGSEHDVLKKIKDDYYKELASVDARYSKDLDEKKLLIKELEDRIKDLDNIANLDDKNIQALEELYKMSKEESKLHASHMSKKQGTNTKNLRMTKEEREANNLSNVISKSDNAPGRKATYELKEALSNFIYGQSGKLLTVRDGGIDLLMSEVRKGASSQELKWIIEDNPSKFASHMNDVYSHVAKSLGYKNWHTDGFKEPLAKMLGKTMDDVKDVSTKDLHAQVSKLYQDGKLNAKQNNDFIELLQRKMKREMLIQEFGNMSSPQFMSYLSKLEDAKLRAEVFGDRDAELALERSKWLDDQSANQTKIVRKNGKDEVQYNSQVAPWVDPKESHINKERALDEDYANPAYTEFAKLQTGDRVDVLDFMIKQGIFDKDVVKKAFDDGRKSTFYKNLNAIVNEVDDLLTTQFKQNWSDMTYGHKRLAIRMALNSVQKGKRIDGEIISHRVVQEMERRTREQATKEVEKTVKPGDRIYFKKEGEVKRVGNRKDDVIVKESDAQFSVVVEKITRKDGVIQYVGKTPDGVEHVARSSDVFRIKQDKTSMSPEDILMNSKLSKYSVASKEELVEQLDKVKSQLYEASNLHSSDAAKVFQEFSIKLQKQKELIKDLESEHLSYEKSLSESGDLEAHITRLEKVEHALNNNEAIETYMRYKGFDVKNMKKEISSVDSGKIWLSDLASSKKIEDTVRWLREEFTRIGEAEVEIGKLTQGQFEEMVNRYLPHVLTPDGQEYFNRMKELSDHGSKVSHDLGYGVKYSPYAKSRTAKGTVTELNDHFRESLKGKNAFAENIADIYMVRAMDNLELMYDDKYMRTMLNVFGKDIGTEGIEKGYKAVMNYGMMRETLEHISSMRLSMEISNSVSAHLRNVIPHLQDEVYKNGKSLDLLIEKEIQDFLKDNWTDDVVKTEFDNYVKSAISSSRLPSKILTSDGTPMVELNSAQMNAIRDSFDYTKQLYVEHTDNSLVKTVRREGSPDARVNAVIDEMYRLDELLKDEAIPTDVYMGQFEHATQRLKQLVSSNPDVYSERVRDILKQYDRAESFTAPQIKQVNEVIVNRANQARKLQQAKDESAFLKLYDKFTHFIKLNQTVVNPGFHGRNYLSNNYLNWLAIGRDALDKNLQVATMVLSKNGGDIQDVLDNKKFGHKQLSRPINIENPHPSLQNAVQLNNGQLHWADVYNLAVRYDVIDKGVFAQDIGSGAASGGLFKKLRTTSKKDGRPISLDPTDTRNFELYKKMTRVGTVVEDQARLIHFIGQLKRGMSPQQASESSKKFLFDYSDLTAFEQNVMKRIFPYYTWLRKNGRLQVSQLIENRRKMQFVAKADNGVEHMNSEDERMNREIVGDWSQGWLQLPFTFNGRKLLLNPALPYMDFNRLPDLRRPAESMKDLFGMVNPLVKAPIEQLINWNSFFGGRIADGEGAGIGDRVSHLAGHFALPNVINNITKDSAAQAGLGVVAGLTGVKATSIDYGQSKQMYLQKDEHFMETLIDGIDRGTMGILDRAFDKVYNGVKGAVTSLLPIPPKDPSSYTGAMAPISKTTYDKLTPEQKKMYEQPSKEQAFFYHKQAMELSKKAYEESGVVSRFIWSLFDMDSPESVAIGRVTSVSDGDTFRIKIGDKEQEVRMLLVDTPETVDPRKPVMPIGEEASAYTKSMITNKDVKLIFDGNSVDQYGRVLAYVELDGRDFNRSLIEQGLGKVRYTEDFDTGREYSRTDDYYDAEENAYYKRLGIWGDSLKGYVTPGVDEGYYMDALYRYLKSRHK